MTQIKVTVSFIGGVHPRLGIHLPNTAPFNQPGTRATVSGNIATGLNISLRKDQGTYKVTIPSNRSPFFGINRSHIGAENYPRAHTLRFDVECKDGAFTLPPINKSQLHTRPTRAAHRPASTSIKTNSTIEISALAQVIGGIHSGTVEITLQDGAVVGLIILPAKKS